MLEITVGASSSSPFSSTTPLTLPLLLRMRSPAAPLRISPPASRSGRAIAWVPPPIPPREQHQEPMVPSTPPKQDFSHTQHGDGDHTTSPDHTHRAPAERAPPTLGSQQK